MRSRMLMLSAFFGLCLCGPGMAGQFVLPPAPAKVHQEIVEEKICMEQSSPGWGGCFRWSNMEYPEKAQFSLDNNLIAKAHLTSNNTMYQTEIAYRALIKAGDYSRLPGYWDNLYRQIGTNDPSWFQLDFALSESRKAAVEATDQGDQAKAQLLLARYYLHGCPQGKLLGTNHTDANHGPAGLASLFARIGAKCKPQPAEAVKYFTMFARNPTVRPSEIQLQSSEIGDWYFNRKQYAEALGWYIATIKIAQIDPAKFSATQAADEFAHQYLWAGHPLSADEFRALADKSVASAQSEYTERADTARRRVALIQDLGIQAVAAYDLKQ